MEFNFLRKLVPDLYTAKDAEYFFRRAKDKEFLFGKSDVDPAKEMDKVYGHPKRVLEEVSDIVKDSMHFKWWPFIFGTYYSTHRKMSMNDINASDILLPVNVATGIFDTSMPILNWHFYTSFVLPLRALYFFGRRGWWRHESIHAMHHHSMADYIEKKSRQQEFEEDKTEAMGKEPGKGNRVRVRYYGMHPKTLEEAAYTIHEAGCEELLTRWQSLKESRGLREKVAAALALGMYMEYVPHMGIRNVAIDVKDKIDEKFPKDRVARIASKVGFFAALASWPTYFVGVTNDANSSINQSIAELIRSYVPNIAGINLPTDNIVNRVYAYYLLGIVGAAISTFRKGLIKSKLEKSSVLNKVEKHRELTTSQYKFPFTYNPVKAFTRSIKLMKYMNKVWDNIPNYRRVESEDDFYRMLYEVDRRLDGKLGKKELDFTKETLMDAMEPYIKTPQKYPVDVYPKELFLPSLYLNAKKLFS